MSPRCLFAVVALGATVVSSTFAQSVAPAPGTAPAPGMTHAPVAAPDPAVTPEEIFETVGWIIADRNNVTQFGMSATEMAAFQKGFVNSATGNPPPANFDACRRAVQEFLNKRVGERIERQAVGNRIEEKEFFVRVDQQPGVKHTPSGLRYEIINPGAGLKPTAADTVVAHYTLSFADGTIVESSKTNGGEPAEFSLGGVIPAWTEGLQLIAAGGQMKLYVPSALGYGDAGSQNGGIPPAKVLVFDVELIAIKSAPVQLPGAPGLPTLTP